jgi:hypothetical protein
MNDLIFKIVRGFGKLKFENEKSKIDFSKTIFISVKNTQASNKMSSVSIEELLDISRFTKFKEEVIDKIVERLEKERIEKSIVENEYDRVQFGEYPTAQAPPPSPRPTQPICLRVPEAPDLRTIKTHRLPIHIQEKNYRLRMGYKTKN